jgi:pantoate--beta-alanine ligase
VVTVVAKLLHIVKPHLAIFGEKDFQQAVIIKQMTRDLNFDVEIITGPIIREEGGLALSSRNKYLNAEDRRNAVVLYQSLEAGKNLYRNGMTDAAGIVDKMEEIITRIPNASIDYIVIVDPLTLEPVNNVTEGDRLALAVYIGSTRLIDNAALTRD